MNAVCCNVHHINFYLWVLRTEGKHYAYYILWLCWLSGNCYITYNKCLIHLSLTRELTRNLHNTYVTTQNTIWYCKKQESNTCPWTPGSAAACRLTGHASAALVLCTGTNLLIVAFNIGRVKVTDNVGMLRNKIKMKFIAVLPQVNRNYIQHTKVAGFAVWWYTPIYSHW
jgi:hypothetical protein